MGFIVYGCANKNYYIVFILVHLKFLLIWKLILNTIFPNGAIIQTLFHRIEAVNQLGRMLSSRTTSFSNNASSNIRYTVAVPSPLDIFIHGDT